MRLLIMALLVGGVAFSPGVAAEASHPKSGNFHLDSIHLAYDDEDFCVNSTGTSQPSRWSEVYSKATTALWMNPDGASKEWDAKAWDLGGPAWRIWFVGHGSNPCQNLSTAERGPIEIEYWIEDDTRSAPQKYLCGGTFDVSCAVADTKAFEAAGHWNYSYYYIYLYKPYAVGDTQPGNDNLANFPYHQINHETGHALGFGDGAGSGDCPSSTSVMHSKAYGCTANLRWPSVADTDSETSIAFGH